MGFARQVADRIIFMDSVDRRVNEPDIFTNPQHERTNIFRPDFVDAHDWTRADLSEQIKRHQAQSG